MYILLTFMELSSSLNVIPNIMIDLILNHGFTNLLHNSILNFVDTLTHLYKTQLSRYEHSRGK